MRLPWATPSAAALIILVLVFIIFAAGYKIMRIPFDDILGILAGSVGNPAILAYGVKTVPPERPDINYAMIFPVGLILKVILVSMIMKL